MDFVIFNLFVIRPLRSFNCEEMFKFHFTFRWRTEKRIFGLRYTKCHKEQTTHNSKHTPFCLSTSDVYYYLLFVSITIIGDGKQLYTVIISSKISLFVVITLRLNLWLIQCESEFFRERNDRRHGGEYRRCGGVRERFGNGNGINSIYKGGTVSFAICKMRMWGLLFKVWDCCIYAIVA